jgi:hypothetical protein
MHPEKKSKGKVFFFLKKSKVFFGCKEAITEMEMG